jgi:hypothetical protein
MYSRKGLEKIWRLQIFEAPRIPESIFESENFVSPTHRPSLPLREITGIHLCWRLRVKTHIQRSGQQRVILFVQTNRPLCLHELNHKLLAAPPRWMCVFTLRRPQAHSAAEGIKSMKNLKRPHREWNPRPSVVQRTASTNCATAYQPLLYPLTLIPLWCAWNIDVKVTCTL